MRYTEGEILICSTNELYGQKYNLIVGDKYQVIEDIEMSDDRVVLDLIHVKTNSRVGIHSDRLFIQLYVYREFRIRQVLR